MAEKLESNQETFRKVYDDTSFFIESIVKEYGFFPSILAMMRDGKASVELKKRYMLRAIDETWVNIIEDTLPALDVLTRNPSKFIEEREEVMPIELSRNISVRSLRHLSQHTNLISKVEGDIITPSKILNVFREETIQTYENKFINTLINRLMIFVSRRYEIAKKAGQDEKTTSLDFQDEFKHHDVNVKMQLRFEIAEPAADSKDKADRNLTFTTDLWRRVERLYDIVSAYTTSEFVQNMGQSYIRPPVMRTNAILKNKNLRQCLALWQFIEGYENAGYSMLVQESLEKVDEDYLKELYSTLALQYFIFRHNVQNDFDLESTLASQISEGEFRPRMVDDTLTPQDTSEFDEHLEGETRRLPMPSMTRYGTLTPEDKMMLESLDTALDAAEILPENEPLPAPIPEPKPNESPAFADEEIPGAAEEQEPEIPAPEEETQKENPEEENKEPEEKPEEKPSAVLDLPLRQLSAGLQTLIQDLKENRSAFSAQFADKVQALLSTMKENLPMETEEKVDPAALTRRKKAIKQAIKKMGPTKKQKKQASRKK